MALNEDQDLTAEEAAALALPDEPEEEPHVDPNADPEATAQPAADPQADPAPAADAEPAPAAAPAAAAADAEPQAAPAAEPAPTKVEAAAPAPLLVVQAPEDASAKLAQITLDKAALIDQLEDGEITTKDYQLALDKLNDAQFELRQVMREAELARKLTEQQIMNQWVADCNAFLGNHPEYAEGSERRNLLDETIKAIAQMPSNRGLSNTKALEKAHKIVNLELGDVAPAAPAPAANKTVVQHKIPTPAAPPNIGALPAAAMNDTTGGEFAVIETLRKSGDVDAYEAAIEKMSEATRARYMRA